MVVQIRSDEIRDQPGVRWLIAPLTEEANRELGHFASQLPGVAEFGELQGEGVPPPPPRVYELNAQAALVTAKKQAVEASPLVRIFRSHGGQVEECEVLFPPDVRCPRSGKESSKKRSDTARRKTAR